MVSVKTNLYYVAHEGEGRLQQVEATGFKESIVKAYEHWEWGKVKEDDIELVFDNVTPLLVVPVTKTNSTKLGRVSDIDDKIAIFRELDGVRRFRLRN